MAERVIDIRFVNKVKDPMTVTERSTGGMVERLLQQKGREFTCVDEGGYLYIRGNSGETVKVPRTNVAYMIVELVEDKPAAKAGGK